jgi:type IV pilus assembly protein PilW
MKPRRPTPCSRRAGSRGVTLVELMIAVTIGLLLVVVIAQLFLGSRQTFATTDDVSRMQDNIRFTQILLTRTIHLAGYKSQANSVTSTVFQTLPALAAVEGVAPTDSDQLTIRYQGSGQQTSAAGCQSTNPPSCAGADGTVVNCLGVRIDAGQMVENQFTIAPGANTQPALFCNGVELVSNVRNMQIMFGEDTDDDLVANRYVKAGTVIDAGKMNNVVSVRVILLFETPTASSKVVADAQEYDLLGDGTAVLSFPNDRRIRRMVVTTINLRNRTP